MKRFRWIWVLPLVQLLLALVCHVYDPHEYRTRSHRDGVVGDITYTFQHSPAWSGRLSKGLNFPALVLAYPLRNETDAIYERNSAYTLIWIAPHDVAFFVAILLFWSWVGRMLDVRRAPNKGSDRSRPLRVTGPLCGVAFGLATATYADSLLAERWVPQRHIGALGIVWSAALCSYFAWRLIRAFDRSGDSTTGFVAVSVPTFLIAALWIGGPFGVTQALGEYLHPTTAKRMLVSEECSVDQSPPRTTMQIVNQYRRQHDLSLQQVFVCTSAALGAVSQDDPKFEALALDGMTQRSWLPLRVGWTYQYRRHFVVVVADHNNGKAVVREAILIQRRSDYLHQNWDRLLTSFTWPYPPS